MKNTTMGAAMTRAGINPIEATLMKALATYLGAGGTVARLNELVAHATAGMPGEGQPKSASDGHSNIAPARQPTREGEDHCLHADKAIGDVPTPREPHHAQVGRTRHADKANSCLPAAREPSKADLAAAKKVRQTAAATVLDTFAITMRQGSRVPIGDVPVAAYGRLLQSAGKRAWVQSREYNLLFLLKEEADKQAHIPQGALTRDIFGVDAVAAKIATATALALPHQAEVSHA